MSRSPEDKTIEERLAKAIDGETPDILDDLMTEFDLDENKNDDNAAANDDGFKRVSAKDTSSARRLSLGSLIAVCAALLFVMTGMLSRFGYTGEPAAVVGIDVNPSIELSVDDKERVVKAEALNSDGKTILGEMDLKGSDVNIACNAVLGSMLAKGYITDMSNSVLLSVRSADEERGRQIEEDLSADMNLFFENSEVAAAILAQYVEDNDELEKFASMYGLSPGKAFLIQRIAADDPTKSPESMVTLSAQELILLAQKKEISDSISYGTVDTSGYIGEEKAIEIALSKAGIQKNDTGYLTAEYDSEDGRIVYEVEFEYRGTEFEYDIDALTGRILSEEMEGPDDISDDSGDDDIDDDDHDESGDDDEKEDDD